MRHFKLQDPPIFMGEEKDDTPVEHWLVKMHRKMKVDTDLMDTPMHRMVYIMNCVDDMAFGHLESRSQTNATKPWKDSDKMLSYLERVFGNPNRRENAENKFQALR